MPAATTRPVAFQQVSYYVASENADGLLDEIYNNIVCFGFCNVTSGTSIAVTVGATASGIDFVLAAGGTIAGTVTNAAGGAPLDDVFVAVFSSTGTFLGGENTNGSGAYSVLMPAGTYFVAIFNATGFANQLYNNIACYSSFCNVTGGTAVTVTTGATTPSVNFALSAAGSITGRVTDAGTLAGVSGLTVQLLSSSGTFLASILTDGSGNYTLAQLPGGSYYVRTSTPGPYINQLYNGVTCLNCNVTTSGGTQVVVAGATVSNINFALVTGGRIGGTVTNVSNAQPIAGVSVQVYDSSGTFAGAVNSGGSGNYLSVALPPGTYYSRTSNGLGLTNRLYNDKRCSTGCVVTNGTAITVTNGNTSGGVNFGLTTAFTFTDSTLVPQVTLVRPVHMIELRIYINQLRSQVGLPTIVFSDTLTAGATTIKVTHISELRTALNDVYDAIGLTRPNFTDPVLTAGTSPIRAVHITELRAAVLAAQ